mmetsp:Transcript_24752/g.57502  ORF Transcript_24752/g.57502 Transcript_24752/m.57502 type:complete len:227 (-) Transcript_24752:141-821(-)
MLSTAAGLPRGLQLQHLGSACLQQSLPRGGASLRQTSEPQRNLLRPDLLLARTHAGGMSTRSSSSRAVVSSRSTACSSAASVVTIRPDTSFRPDASPTNRRLFATAPAAPQLAVTSVEEATGVRLSDRQLQALQQRCHDGHSGSFGADPRAGTLRREVFSSLVLRPGQFPRLGPDSSSGEAEALASQQRASVARAAALPSHHLRWAASGQGGSALVPMRRGGALAA